MPDNNKKMCYLIVGGLLFATVVIALVYVVRRLMNITTDAKDCSTQWEWDGWDSATVGITCAVTMIVLLFIITWLKQKHTHTDVVLIPSSYGSSPSNPNYTTPSSTSNISDARSSGNIPGTSSRTPTPRTNTPPTSYYTTPYTTTPTPTTTTTDLSPIPSSNTSSPAGVNVFPPAETRYNDPLLLQSLNDPVATRMMSPS